MNFDKALRFLMICSVSLGVMACGNGGSREKIKDSSKYKKPGSKKLAVSKVSKINKDRSCLSLVDTLKAYAKEKNSEVRVYLSDVRLLEAEGLTEMVKAKTVEDNEIQASLLKEEVVVLAQQKKVYEAQMSDDYVVTTFIKNIFHDSDSIDQKDCQQVRVKVSGVPQPVIYTINDDFTKNRIELQSQGGRVMVVEAHPSGGLKIEIYQQDEEQIGCNKTASGHVKYVYRLEAGKKLSENIQISQLMGTLINIYGGENKPQNLLDGLKAPTKTSRGKTKTLAYGRGPMISLPEYTYHDLVENFIPKMKVCEEKTENEDNNKDAPPKDSLNHPEHNSGDPSLTSDEEPEDVEPKSD